MEKLYLYTLIEDCSCPEDFLNCTEEDAKGWEEESSKAVVYFELIKKQNDDDDAELFDYGCVHLDDLPVEAWKEYCYNGETEAVINFIKEIYPFADIAEIGE